MAKLQLSDAWLLSVLFTGEHGLRLLNARFDLAAGCVEIEIEGPQVPKVEHVRCIITDAQRTFEFVETLGINIPYVMPELKV